MRLSQIIGPGEKVLAPKGGCHNCPRKKRDFVPATLKPTKLIVLGEAPGETESKTGEGFTGVSGSLLRDLLTEVGIEDYSLTNTIHCRPPKNAAPTPVEIGCCLNQYVLNELASYPFVLMAGNVPATALFPGRAADRIRGNLGYHPDFPNTRFFGSYHPAFVLRRKDMQPELRKQLERLKRILDGDSEANIELVQGDSPYFRKLLGEMLASGFISLDLETDRLESWEQDGEIRSIAFTNNEHQAVFAHQGEAHWQWVVDEIRSYLSDPASKVLGHNIGYDLVWAEAKHDFSVRARNIWDTSHLYYLARGDKMPHLKGLVSRELDGYRHLVFQPHKEKNLERLGKYNGEDVVYPIALLKKGLGLVGPKTVDLFMRVGGPSGFHLRRIQHHGIYFDYKLWQRSAKQVAERRKELIQNWQRDDPQFNPRQHLKGKGSSGAGIEKYLFSVKGYPIIKKTASDKPSTDASVLKTLAKQLEDEGKDSTPIKNLLLLRKYDKEESTYVEPYEGHVWPDGVVRSSYTNTWTDSGRRSSRKPNVQNLPRKGIVRKFFRARPGNILVQADFSQIELRIAMCLARDPVGIAAYMRGEDLHTETARAISGLLTPTKEQRTHAKPVNFACIYGAHWTRVQQQAAQDYGVWLTDEQAQEYHAMFFRRYSHLQPWHESCHQELRDNRGRAMHIVGHPHVYEDWDHEDQKKRDHAFRAHLNSKCQGPAAYINMYTLSLTDRAIVDQRLPARIVHEEHDSVLVDTDPAARDEVCGVIAESTKTVAEWIKEWFIVPLVVEFEHGPNRGELEAYNPN